MAKSGFVRIFLTTILVSNTHSNADKQSHPETQWRDPQQHSYPFQHAQSVENIKILKNTPSHIQSDLFLGKDVEIPSIQNQIFGQPPTIRQHIKAEAGRIEPLESIKYDEESNKLSDAEYDGAYVYDDNAVYNNEDPEEPYVENVHGEGSGLVANDEFYNYNYEGPIGMNKDGVISQVITDDEDLYPPVGEPRLATLPIEDAGNVEGSGLTIPEGEDTDIWDTEPEYESMEENNEHSLPRAVPVKLTLNIIPAEVCNSKEIITESIQAAALDGGDFVKHPLSIEGRDVHIYGLSVEGVYCMPSQKQLVILIQLHVANRDVDFVLSRQTGFVKRFGNKVVHQILPQWEGVVSAVVTKKANKQDMTEMQTLVSWNYQAIPEIPNIGKIPSTPPPITSTVFSVVPSSSEKPRKSHTKRPPHIEIPTTTSAAATTTSVIELADSDDSDPNDVDFKELYDSKVVDVQPINGASDGVGQGGLDGSAVPSSSSSDKVYLFVLAAVMIYV